MRTMLCSTDGIEGVLGLARLGRFILVDGEGNRARRGGFSGRCRPLLLAWCILLVPSEGLRAHDLFTEYVHHRIQVSATTNHLDLTFVLTFFEQGSEKERRTMDADGNGRIGRGEVDAYVKRLSGRLTNSPVVVVGDRRMRAVPLYEPKLDLLGYQGVEWAHHRLALSYFVPISLKLAEGAVLQVQDPFWTSLPAVVVVERSELGELGLSMRPDGGAEFGLGKLREGEEREFRWVVEKMDQRPPGSVEPAARE